MAGGLRLSGPAPGGAAASPWLVMATLMGCGACLAGLMPAAALDWQPGLAASEPWRWWTSAFVHWSPAHLGANLLGVAALALFGLWVGLPGWATLCWALAWPLGHLGLWVEPQLSHFGGLSGVLHAGAAVVSVALLVAPTPPRQRAGLLLVAALCVKLLCENPAAQPAGLRAAVGIPELVLATRAHAGGALAGWGLALVAVALSACTKPRQPS